MHIKVLRVYTWLYLQFLVRVSVCECNCAFVCSTLGVYLVCAYTLFCHFADAYKKYVRCGDLISGRFRNNSKRDFIFVLFSHFFSSQLLYRFLKQLKSWFRVLAYVREAELQQRAEKCLRRFAIKISRAHVHAPSHTLTHIHEKTTSTSAHFSPPSPPAHNTLYARTVWSSQPNVHEKRSLLP